MLDVWLRLEYAIPVNHSELSMSKLRSRVVTRTRLKLMDFDCIIIFVCLDAYTFVKSFFLISVERFF